MLDDILSACLLRSGQKAVGDVLRACLELVLELAVLAGDRYRGRLEEYQAAPLLEDLWERFRKRMATLVCLVQLSVLLDAYAEDVLLDQGSASVGGAGIRNVTRGRVGCRGTVSEPVAPGRRNRKPSRPCHPSGRSRLVGSQIVRPHIVQTCLSFTNTLCIGANVMILFSERYMANGNSTARLMIMVRQKYYPTRTSTFEHHDQGPEHRAPTRDGWQTRRQTEYVRDETGQGEA